VGDRYTYWVGRCKECRADYVYYLKNSFNRYGEFRQQEEETLSRCSAAISPRGAVVIWNEVLDG